MYTWVHYQLVTWILLAVELSVMYSPRLTSGVYGSLRGSGLARDSRKAWGADINFAHSAQNSASEVEK